MGVWVDGRERVGKCEEGRAGQHCQFSSVEERVSWMRALISIIDLYVGMYA